MRLAILSPLPPSKSGIADYSAALAEAISPLCALDVFGSLDDLPDLSAYDAVLYQIGNNGAHGFVYEEAISNPGIVVLHEANLHHLIADITIKRGDWDAYMRAVEFDGGRRALDYAQAVRRLEIGPDYEGVPMLRNLLRRSRGLIVHSEFVGGLCRDNGYQGPMAVIPHGAWLPETDGASWRNELGLTETEILFGVFGHLKPYKRIAETLRAFRRLVKQHRHARLILVGEPHPDFPVRAAIDALDLRDSVRVLGFAPIEAFVGYMAACDAILNLRYPTVGESSGSMLRALGLGKPVVVSDVGAFAEFPEEVCLKVPVGGPSEEDLIFEYMRYLASDREAAAEFGRNAREWVRSECNWDKVARQYVDFARAVRDSGDQSAIPSDAAEVPVAVLVPSPGEPVGGMAEDSKEVAASPVPGSIAEDEARTDRVSEIDVPSRESLDASAAKTGEGSDLPPNAETERAGFETLIRELQAPAKIPEPVAHPLASELLSWAPNDAARSYLLQHLSRLTSTLDMLPDGADGQCILEMGCYMQMTPLLSGQKGFGEVRGCYYGPLGESTERTVKASDGRNFSCMVDTFDAERDPYPYPDDRFDAVLCTELFEHLGYDPFHCLAEVNRILKPGGLLLLTTPNVCSLRAIAAILEHYHPGFFPAFMKPGADGTVDPRHHREYATREIQMALEDAGFRVRALRTSAYWSAPEPELEWVRQLLERYELDESNRGECIFALGEKVGAVRERYPKWLYHG